jgi:hypothetical protein
MAENEETSSSILRSEDSSIFELRQQWEEVRTLGVHNFKQILKVSLTKLKTER